MTVKRESNGDMTIQDMPDGCTTREQIQEWMNQHADSADKAAGAPDAPKHDNYV